MNVHARRWRAFRANSRAFYHSRRKAPSFSYGDIRLLLCYNVLHRVGASTLGVEAVRPA